MKVMLMCRIYSDSIFYSDIDTGLYHNPYGATMKYFNHPRKIYRLHDKYYGNDLDFKNDEEWRRFVKLLAFQ